MEYIGVYKQTLKIYDPGGVKMKLKAILAMATDVDEFAKMLLSKYCAQGTTVDVSHLEQGTAINESSYDDALNIPHIIKIAEKAEEEGYDGVFIDCFKEPGLAAIRESLSIPVVGAARMSMYYSAELAHSFSVLTPFDRTIAETKDIAFRLGLMDKLASVHSLKLSLSNALGFENLQEHLLNRAIEAIENYDAHLILLGCAAWVGLEEGLKSQLSQKGYNVPVLSPIVAFKYLENLVSLGLAHSKRTYMPPSKQS